MKTSHCRHSGWKLGYAGLQPEDPREIGPYQLLGQLGSGGMGRVFLGMSAGGRPIAVKVIRTELATDPEFRARFRREVAAAQKVSGLFTALVVDADLDSPMPWLATAYVAGPSLSEAVRGHGPLPVCTVLALAAGLAESLSAIHAAGVVHGDLKPSNVLLAEDGPRVIDFGISQAAEASVATGNNLMIGSPGFMSPEQVLGFDIGPASDMFSLGAVLTFAATGEGPFGSGSNAALMYRVVNSPANLDRVPGELRGLIGNCLAKHPSDRPTARELLTQAGAIQPSPGWLAESIISSFTLDRSAAGASGGIGDLLALTGPDSSQPQPGAGGGGRPGRHRISRSMASVCLSGGLVAASAVAVFALIGADRTPHSPGVQPQARSGAVATAPSSASNAPASPGSSSSASPRVSVAPSAFLTPSSSGLLTPSSFGLLSPSSSGLLSPSLTPTAGTSPTAKPTKSSPQPSKSASSSSSPSTSPSSSPSSSPSGSTSPSSSPSGSTSPSPSPSSSPSSSTPAASSPSSPAATATSSPSATST
jgi:eukaryotic-like serine/threonine-protein kinase